MSSGEAVKKYNSAKSGSRRGNSSLRRRGTAKPRWRRPSARQLEKIREDWSHCT